MKYFYFAMAEKIDDKIYNSVRRIGTHENLNGLFKSHKIIVLSPCETKKEAENVVDMWTQADIENGISFWNN